MRENSSRGMPEFPSDDDAGKALGERRDAVGAGGEVGDHDDRRRAALRDGAGHETVRGAGMSVSRFQGVHDEGSDLRGSKERR